MKFFRKLFNKKERQSENPYVTMGKLGVSPEYMKMYQEAVKKLK